ncbi:MAG TPA: protease pro-enzyme activation domain-containing protein [Capillimicrobium sp.]|nr:protease pro-enzyme activation domain-containing protein [Capillimicrobium sp.]
MTGQPCPRLIEGTHAPFPQADRELTILPELSASPRLERFVRQVSDPTSPRYRQYRTVNRLVKRFGPSRQIKRQTRRFAADRGLSARIDATGMFATVTGAPADVRAAFPPAASARAATSTRYRPTVPAELAPGVAGATTLADLPTVTRQAPLNPAASQSAAARTGSPAGCDAGRFASTNGQTAGFTPNQYLGAYGHAALHARGLTGRGVRMALIEIDGFDPDDVATFAACFGTTVPPITTYPVGIPEALEPGAETTLDLEVLAAAAPGLEAIDVYESASSWRRSAPRRSTRAGSAAGSRSAARRPPRRSSPPASRWPTRRPRAAGSRRWACSTRSSTRSGGPRRAPRSSAT